MKALDDHAVADILCGPRCDHNSRKLIQACIDRGFTGDAFDRALLDPYAWLAAYAPIQRIQKARTFGSEAKS